MASKTFEFETETKVVRVIKSDHKVQVDSAYIGEFSQHIWTAKKTTQNYASTEFYTGISDIGEVSMAYFALDLNPKVVRLILRHPPKDYRKESIRIRGVSHDRQISSVLTFCDGSICAGDMGPIVEVPAVKGRYTDEAISEYLWPYYLDAMRMYDKYVLETYPHVTELHFLSSMGIREAIWTPGS